ncbi:thioredoxin family protein [Budviciaceae bacterium BWR-B9]|uniref:Thioredoxin family protein n=1 Tax=Limnobaculum allomyrinae TaxID=2791986 RepID=A0ABS1ISE5_9GAMM|nr:MULTISPECIES: thioredoxin family protein [Limnobaculum]MBK5144693.1 thioredoxin family protein [Limnobaculum allomyrinae]MBV7692356.1 thioredoxin family protein [Limnobaculum sp. M2-1]
MVNKTKEVIFYHAGCPVCISAENSVLSLIDPATKVRIVHLGQEKEKIADAEKAGVKSVPALVFGDEVLHINFGASLNDLK